MDKRRNKPDAPRNAGRMRRSALTILITLLANPASAETTSFKCSFADGKMDDQVLYVVNSTTKDVNVIGDFGSHSAKLLSYSGNFYFVLEPNNGASVSTIIHFVASETAVAVRTTLGMLSQEQYNGIPENYKLAGDALRFMTISLKGRCPIQR